uniref:Uncharacterized protein n=1 Tax=Cacopsylla melanoneura TaxID=428564 RepID=A0A8D8PTP8_9HEMI
MSCMSLKKLQTYQNACIRYIFGLKKHDHVSELRSSVMWLPVGRRLEHQTLCLLWKTMNEELLPSYTIIIPSTTTVTIQYTITTPPLPSTTTVTTQYTITTPTTDSFMFLHRLHE